MGKESPSPYHPIGPCITGIIDNRSGHANPLDGYVIEEGSVPAALAPFLQVALELMPGNVDFSGSSLVDKFREKLSSAGSFFLGPYFRKGAMERTQVYLIMSHDSSQVYLTLKDDKPMLEFIGAGRGDRVKELYATLEKATAAVGDTFVYNPFHALMCKAAITVHPIGGVCMSRDGTGATGASNHFGEVFTGEGTETHRGLVITDGAVIPTALGGNPFATITALAERSMEIYARREGLQISTLKNEPLDLFGLPQHPHDDSQRVWSPDEEEESASISSAMMAIMAAQRLDNGGIGFTEVMSGFIHRDDGRTGDNRETYERAARTAEALCESARFYLSMQSFDINKIVNDPDHQAMVTGTFSCPILAGSPFMVQRGDFNLFVQDHKAPGTQNLVYDFDMKGVDGRTLKFFGYKVVDSSVALSPSAYWRATTTLYVTIFDAPMPGLGPEDIAMTDKPSVRGRVLARGIMRIQPADFAHQVLTLAPTGTGLLTKALSAGSFLSFFTRKSLSLFLTPFAKLQYPLQNSRGFINERTPDATYEIVADDGVRTRMHMWEPTHVPEGQEIKNLFMIPGASVDHHIYALPTIKYHAVDYFTRAGYRVFVSVHRIGLLMVAENNWTTYDARLDLKACLVHIRAAYGPDPVYCIAHCMGSVAFSTGLLDGSIPTSPTV
jgi:hypothetical protein